MKKIYYSYQKFLLDSDYNHTPINEFDKYEIENIEYLGQQYNIIDYIRGEIIRKINLTYLDENIDTKEDFENLVFKLNGIDEIIIVNDRLTINNPIIEDYSNNTLKAFVFQFKARGLKVKVWNKRLNVCD